MSVRYKILLPLFAVIAAAIAQGLWSAHQTNASQEAASSTIAQAFAAAEHMGRLQDNFAAADSVVTAVTDMTMLRDGEEDVRAFNAHAGGLMENIAALEQDALSQEMLEEIATLAAAAER